MWNFDKIAHLDQEFSNFLLDWVKVQNFTPELFNGIETSRNLCWFGWGIQFFQLARRQEFDFFKAARTIEDDDLLVALRSAYFPEADSVLLYHYPPGASIGEHRDKGFDPQVVLVNLFDRPRNLLGDKDAVIKFSWGGNSYFLTDGQVIRFDSSVKHSVFPCRVDRYSLQFRKVKKNG